MDRKSVKKYIYWGLFILFVIGSIAAGGPFQFIDIIIVRPIVNILFVIFNLVHDFGLAIIIFTVIVKICMLPIVRKQLNQMKLIRKIQPMLTEIKKNCNGNKQLESMQTMDLYRRYNVKPFSSVVTLIIQLPIFIALFSAITVIATPKLNDNLMNRAYSFVAYQGSEIAELEGKQQEYLAKLEAVQNGGTQGGESTEGQGAEGDTENAEKERGNENSGNGNQNQEVEYDFHPQLFGLVDLNVKASDLMVGKFSPSAVVILIFAVLSAVVQYLVTKQQMPSGKAEKSKKFRDLIQQAKEGKELDDTDISNITTKQMSTMMPIMMFILMFNFNGALVFYYLLTNLLTLVQQKFILRKVNEEIDEVTDKAVLKQLKNIQEGEVIENKKTGTKIRRVSAKEVKKARKTASEIAREEAEGKIEAKASARQKKSEKTKGGKGASKKKGK